jgi:metal-responsive CopG/Arc/MetJ family transcriptional regulator
MEIVSIKLEKKFLKYLEAFMQAHHYATKTEFIREAIRDKIKLIEKEKALKALDKIYGSSKHKTTDEDLHKARDKAADQLEKKFLIRKFK